MDQRTNKFHSGSLIISKYFFGFVFAFNTLGFCQNNIIKEYRYNDAIVTLEDHTERSVLLMNMNNDSLLLLENGDQNWYSFNSINGISVKSMARSSSANWLGFFSGIWLGNMLFYRSESGRPGESVPTALMTRDYPEGVGAIAMNALFGVAGMAIANLLSPTNVSTGFDFSGDKDECYREWQYFKAIMQGDAASSRKRSHFQIQTSSLRSFYQEQI